MKQKLIIGIILTVSAGVVSAANLLIRDATVIDGTGAPALTASVRVAGERILAVGDLATRGDDKVIDASNLILAPGFIDTHSHYDIDQQRCVFPAVSQGITTVVRGQDGFSYDSMHTYMPLPEVIDSFERSPVAVNIASYAPHNSIRYRILGEDYQRAATPDEIDAMRALLVVEMKAGALGLSTGLEYDPGIYASSEEIVSLAKVAANHGGRYVSHIRSEDRYFWKAIDEIIQIGRQAEIPVQISHMKLGAKYLWGQSDRLLTHLDDARNSGVDVSADIYPYEFWRATITVLFPDRDYTDRKSAEYVLENLVPADGLILARYETEPALENKSIAEIAELWNMDTASTLMEITARGDALNRSTGRQTEYVIAKGMREQDIARLIAWPHTNICSDGYLASDHPRGSGSFPRVLARYTGSEELLSMVDAIHKMTALSARHSGIVERGTIAPGSFADLVLFDPKTIRDRASYEQPTLSSVGIERVWVNGVEVYHDGATTGAYPGQVIRRQQGSVIDVPLQNPGK